MQVISNSQAAQDLFALERNQWKRDGFFIDIGCAFYRDSSNTFLLEDSYDWDGLLFDVDPQYQADIERYRSSPFILADATKVDFSSVFAEYAVPSRIDYLSLDIHPPDATLAVLERLPLDEYVFSVITYEHDSYRAGEGPKNQAKSLLESHGYLMVNEDVTYDGVHPFEDWYVYSDVHIGD
jgi:hypothetical protein